MEEGDRQRGVIVECSSRQRTGKQKEKKVREHSKRKVKIWRMEKCNRRVSHKSYE